MPGAADTGPERGEVRRLMRYPCLSVFIGG